MPLGPLSKDEGGRARHPFPDAAQRRKRCGLHVLPRQRRLQVSILHGSNQPSWLVFDNVVHCMMLSGSGAGLMQFVFLSSFPTRLVCMSPPDKQTST